MTALTWLLVAASLSGVLVGIYLSGDPPLPDLPHDRYWGEGDRQTDGDQDVKRFTVNVSTSDLTDLNRRLDLTRIGHDDLEGIQFQDGVSISAMRAFTKYWRNKYSWSQQEEKLNSLPQFVTNIDGIDVHFIHVKAKKQVTQKTALPMLLLHGWPGSVWEMYKLIPMLTDPALHDGRHRDVFDVICPSLPGFGFSGAPRKPGFDALAMAQMFVKLMQRLGHEKFYIQGGDWGGVIATTMAQVYPKHIRGAHLNMFTAPLSTLRAGLTNLAIRLCPTLILDRPEKHFAERARNLYPTLLKESGYLHLQATKPHTIAFPLNDSPVGLAAYILNLFSTWTNLNNLDLEDGGLTEKFTMDELLTNVMIYWLNGNIGSSMRLYKEYFGNMTVFLQLDGVGVKVPVGLVTFPHELVYVPRVLAAARYKNIIQHTVMPRGGHFAAMEEPELLASDISSFVRKNEEIITGASRMT